MADALLWILSSTFFVSLVSFVGILVLVLNEKLLNRMLLVLVALSTGALMGGAFLHLLPEAITKAGVSENALMSVFLYLLSGFCLFFVFEHFISWHHHHTTSHSSNCIKPFSYLMLVSDGIHNFIDGLIIAGSFMVSFDVGIVTTLAIVFHEIPQEIGDFGVLIYGGFGKVKALIFNFASALTALLGGLAGYFLSSHVGGFSAFLLPFAAGSFIYIAASDLIPEIKHKESLAVSLVHFTVFLAGIGIILLMRIIFGD